MYLTHLEIEHLKRFGQFSLDFLNPDGTPRMWTVIIGENGTGKTSILQAIALSASGNQQLGSLSEPVAGHLRNRRYEREMVVLSNFRFGEQGSQGEYHNDWPHDRVRPERYDFQSLVVMLKGQEVLRGIANYFVDGKMLEPKKAERTTRLPPGVSRKRFRLQAMDPLDAARANSTPLWFVAGYGVARSIPDVGEVPSIRLAAIDRLRPLFNPMVRMTSTAFSNYFSDKDAEGGKALIYAQALRKALFKVESLLPDVRNLELRGRGGVRRAGDLQERDRFIQVVSGEEIRLPLVALSHGYQSMIAWIADLVGHVLLEAGEEVEPEDMEGLVLIDELDLYLHPKWQASVVTALRETFPKIQFIATTHSPVILSGLEPHEIVRLGVDSHGDVVRVVPDPDSGDWTPGKDPSTQPDPRTMTGTEVYQTYLDIDRLTLNPLGEKIRTYFAHANDPERNDFEDEEMRTLRAVLDASGIQGLPEPTPRRTDR